MLFYNTSLVDWKQGKNAPEDSLEKKVWQQITELKSEHFGKEKKGLVQLRYPNGVRVKNMTSRGEGKYEPRKIFLLDTLSFDGTWRYSPIKPKDGVFKNPNGNHIKIQDPTLFYEEDIELIWFLKYHCPQMKSGKVFFEDFEKIAADEMKEIVSDIDIKFALYSKNSPISKDATLLREVASIFRVENHSRLGLLELKNSLYHKVKEGDDRNDKYINYAKFEELTDNSGKRFAAATVRKAVETGTIKWKSDERAWYIYAGDEYVTELLKLKPNDVSSRDELLVKEILEKPAFKGKVYAELGVNNFNTKGEVKELGRPALMTMCKDLGIPTTNKSTVEELVGLYCEKMGIEKP